MFGQITAEIIRQLREAAAERKALLAEVEALRADAERLRLRGEAYEAAFNIAYRATYQSHNGHWDRTMQGGAGCPECIKAREARAECDTVLREGLQRLADAAKEQR